jgi:ribosomal-protein-alanine N-acetyltransferase
MTAVVTAGNADCEALSRLHGASFAQRWTAASIKGLLDTPGTFVIAAGPMSDPDGFVMARVAADEAEVLTIAVADRMRRKGVGAALVMDAARHASDMGARAMFLEVGKTNEAARALYAKLGFLEVGQRRAYYQDHPGANREDALTLRAPLPLGKSA